MQNDCGSLLKGAILTLDLNNDCIEQKVQTGNIISLRIVKEVLDGDRAEVEYNNVLCKDKKNSAFLYTSTKTILKEIFIYDHRSFETSTDTKRKKAAKELQNTDLRPV